MGPEVIATMNSRAETIHALPLWRLLLLCTLGGMLVAMGAMIGVCISTGIDSSGPQSFMFAVGFVAAFSMAILCGTPLFTEVNAVFPVLLLARRRPARDVARLALQWVLVLAGNYLGTLIFSLLVSGAQLWHFEPAWVARLAAICRKRVLMVEAIGGAKGWFGVVASGGIANFVIGIATFLGSEARDLPGKIIAVAFPIIAFAVMGAAHTPALMALYSLALVEGIGDITWAKAWGWSLTPAAIGNVLGGSLLVAVPFFQAYK